MSNNLAALFPDYRGVLMEPLFKTPVGNVQPDLVLVRSDGLGWGLVEVELEGHSFGGHVLPQLGKLREAESDSKLVTALITALPHVEPSAIRVALSHRPAVFLVIHGSSRRHVAKLMKLAVEVRDVDILKAPDRPDDHILIITDPTVRRRELAALAERDRNPMTQNTWKLSDLGIAKLLTTDGKIEVDVLSTRSFWSATVVQGGLLLRQPSGISDAESDVDSMSRARVFVDDEHRVLSLEPAGGAI